MKDSNAQAALAALKGAARYLEHPDVQAIPFAQPASVVLKRVNSAINLLEFGEHLKQASDTVKLWPAWKRGILGGPSLSEIDRLELRISDLKTSETYWKAIANQMMAEAAFSATE